MRPLKFLMFQSNRPAIVGSMMLSATIVASPFCVSGAHAQNAALPAVTAPSSTALNATTLSLRQKWTAGQQLSYGVSLSGTASIQASPNTRSMFAGIPMDVEVRMEGDTTLDTLSVDELGTGTVAMRVGRLLARAETFGQKFELSVREGKLNTTLNGQRLGGNRPQSSNAFTNPAFAFLISDRGRLQSVVPIKTAAPKTPVAEEANPANADRSSVLPFDPAGFVQSILWRVVPNLWPQLPVKTGEKWSEEVQWPADEMARIAAAKSGRPQSQAKDAALPLGKIDFTLMGEEEVGGRKTVRIALDGAFGVDENKAGAMKSSIDRLGDSQKGITKDASKDAAAPNSKAANTKTAREAQWESKLDKATQKVTGSVWFDPQVGQVVRAELQLTTQASARDVAVGNNKAKSAAGKAGGEPDSWLDFSGTLQLQLKDVQQKTAAAQPTSPIAGNGA